MLEKCELEAQLEAPYDTEDNLQLEEELRYTKHSREGVHLLEGYLQRKLDHV